MFKSRCPDFKSAMVITICFGSFITEVYARTVWVQQDSIIRPYRAEIVATFSKSELAEFRSRSHGPQVACVNPLLAFALSPSDVDLALRWDRLERPPVVDFLLLRMTESLRKSHQRRKYPGGPPSSRRRLCSGS
jgi:hypothetical protein